MVSLSGCIYHALQDKSSHICFKIVVDCYFGFGLSAEVIYRGRIEVIADAYGSVILLTQAKKNSPVLPLVEGVLAWTFLI